MLGSLRGRRRPRCGGAAPVHQEQIGLETPVGRWPSTTIYSTPYTRIPAVSCAVPDLWTHPRVKGEEKSGIDPTVSFTARRYIRVTSFAKLHASALPRWLYVFLGVSPVSGSRMQFLRCETRSIGAGSVAHGLQHMACYRALKCMYGDINN